MILLHSLPNETIAFIVFIIGMCVYTHAAIFNARTAALAPSLFTTFGIFFTFVGIALGLLEFDAKNIQASVPALLDGLRTAFWASVFGVGAALTVKLRVAIWGHRTKKGEPAHPQGATVDDLAAHLIAVQQALVGSDDSTLITQLKLGRQESNDRLDSLRRVLEEFARNMAENNSKALIEALKDVMKDFNAKINEQFGDNFKQLNAAVEAILVWQERYREQMGEMITQQERNTKSLEQASLRFESLVTNAERYTQTANDLAHLLQAIEAQRASLQESMKALGELFVAASRSLPEIETRIVDFAEQITRSSKLANEDMTTATRASVETMRDTVNQVVNQATEQLQALERSLKAVETTVLDCARQIGDGSGKANDFLVRAAQENANALKAALVDGQRVLNEGIRAANDGFNSQVLEIVGKTKEQGAALEKSLKAVETTVLDSARQIGEGSSKANDVMVRAAQENASAIKAALVDGQRMIADGIAAANGAMLKSTQDNTNAQKTALIEVQKVLNDGVRAANDGFNSQVQEMISKTKEQVAALDLALQEELTNSLNTLGRQLTGLSQQFVADYAPLTERLRDLVAVAGRV